MTKQDRHIVAVTAILCTDEVLMIMLLSTR